jgi:hypothetical protein
LIVLVRNKPEEVVLRLCKTDGSSSGGSGDGNQNGGCMSYNIDVCTECSTAAGS